MNHNWLETGDVTTNCQTLWSTNRVSLVDWSPQKLTEYRHNNVQLRKAAASYVIQYVTDEITWRKAKPTKVEHRSRKQWLESCHHTSSHSCSVSDSWLCNTRWHGLRRKAVATTYRTRWKENKVCQHFHNSTHDDAPDNNITGDVQYPCLQWTCISTWKDMYRWRRTCIHVYNGYVQHPHERICTISTISHS